MVCPSLSDFTDKSSGQLGNKMNPYRLHFYELQKNKV